MADLSGSREERLDRVLAEYLQTVEAGAPLSREELLARHPDLADELRAYFADEDRLGGAIAALKSRSVSASTVWREPSTLDADQAGGQPVAWASRAFGDYELLQEIGRGGMGVVYKAHHISLNRVVALKMILAGELANEAAVRRFRAEAETAARLEHPNIVPIYEVGQCQGQHYFTMALVEGGSLADRLAQGPLPPREAAQLLGRLAAAMTYAHERGVIHRDLKPGNVLLSTEYAVPSAQYRVPSTQNAMPGLAPQERTEDAEAVTVLRTAYSVLGTPKITDFGLTKRLDAGPGATATGDVLGTASYMAPEQAAGQVREINSRTDVYSLGAVLYATLTGRPPFLAENSLETLLQVMDQEPVSPRRLNRAVPRDLETICLKCLEKEPKKRYGSARELGEDLERFLAGEPIRARPPGPIGRLRRWARKHPALAVTWVALGGFYLNHLVLLFLRFPGEGGFFHQFLTALVAVWAGGAAAFDYLSGRLQGRSAALVPYGWTALDVGLFTAYLFLSEGPRSALVPGYLLLLAGTPLRAGVGLVWFGTGLTVASYVSLEVVALNRDPDRAVPVYQAVIFVLSLIVLGLIQHLLLRRLPRDGGPRAGPLKESRP